MREGFLYELVIRLGLGASAARTADVLLARPLAVVTLLIAAAVLSRVGARLARRAVKTLQERSPIRPGSPRSELRAGTLSQVLATLVRVVVWSMAALLILGVVGLNLAPLLAGAGIAGIAVGFGAQTLVRDVLAGFFILSEDQYGVGDVITVGSSPTGTVEDVTLRITRLRSTDGVVWFVPNGEIKLLGRHEAGPTAG
ncbi:MAG TPA: mechanosensitive ion channel domain-containing protein [Acidimicrobiales bacterium]|nr:mechanosensitive ion channel domain-containing protein [Acidimicrobiales bacterium]